MKKILIVASQALASSVAADITRLTIDDAVVLVEQDAVHVGLKSEVVRERGLTISDMVIRQVHVQEVVADNLLRHHRNKFFDKPRFNHRKR